MNKAVFGDNINLQGKQHLVYVNKKVLIDGIFPIDSILNFDGICIKSLLACKITAKVIDKVLIKHSYIKFRRRKSSKTACGCVARFSKIIITSIEV